jgi:hypothetical protein
MHRSKTAGRRLRRRPVGMQVRTARRVRKSLKPSDGADINRVGLTVGAGAAVDCRIFGSILVQPGSKNDLCALLWLEAMRVPEPIGADPAHSLDAETKERGACPFPARR